jgi:Protein of unknown function (DUF2934)
MARTKSANPRPTKSAKSSVAEAEQNVTATNGVAEAAAEKKATETLNQPSAAKSASQKSQNGSRSQNGAAKVSDEQIRERAYQLYLERGRQHGNHEDDWFRAESELRGHSR